MNAVFWTKAEIEVAADMLEENGMRVCELLRTIAGMSLGGDAMLRSDRSITTARLDGMQNSVIEWESCEKRAS